MYIILEAELCTSFHKLRDIRSPQIVAKAQKSDHQLLFQFNLSPLRSWVRFY